MRPELQNIDLNTNFDLCVPSYVRFTSWKPPRMVYTSYFTVLDMSAAAALRGNATNSTLRESNISTNSSSTASKRPSGTGGASLYTPHLTLVLPGTTITSALAPRPPTASPTPTASAVSVEDESEFEKHDSPQEVRQVAQKTSSGAGRLGGIDLERLKFRLVFIFWPTLVGISMAL